jgi:hypothetical protein
MSKLQTVIIVCLGTIVLMIFMIIGLLIYSNAVNNPVQIRSIMPHPTSTPTIITGKGDDILSFNVQTEASYIIRSLHDDKGHFIIVPFNKTTGQRMASIVNCLNDCQNSTIVTFGPGEWLLEIDSEGYWGLEMERQ